MVVISNESVAWILTSDGVLAKLINLKLREYFSALGLTIKNVTCKSFAYDLTIFINYKISFDGKNVEEAKSTTFEHNNILHLATYVGQPLTTGSWTPDHAKTETMNLESGEWESGPDYPFHSM